MTFFDPDGPFGYAEIRGGVTVSEEGGRELIDELSAR